MSTEGVPRPFRIPNVVSLVFELVSAYGTVGLSLGVPYVRIDLQISRCTLTWLFQANYSFSGALSPLSKLIVCVVMLRGRHRGLPVAIDRAVMLPFEFRDQAEEDITEEAGIERQMSTTELAQNGEIYHEKGPQERRSWRSGSSDSRRRTSRIYDTDPTIINS